MKRIATWAAAIVLVIGGLAYATTYALHSQFMGQNVLQYYAGATPIFAIDGTNLKTQTIGKISAANSAIALGTPVGSGTDTQTATFTIKDEFGTTLTVPTHVRVYMSTDAAGEVISSSGVHTSVAISGTSASILKTNTALLDFDVIAVGSFVLTFTNTSGSGIYTDHAVLVAPDGKIVVSSALAVPNT